MSDYPDSITMAKLFERVSAKGNIYFSGRLGLLNIAIFKTQEVSETGQAIWVMKASEARSKADYQAKQQEPRRATDVQMRPEDRQAAARDFQRPFDDEVPF